MILTEKQRVIQVTNDGLYLTLFSQSVTYHHYGTRICNKKTYYRRLLVALLGRLPRPQKPWMFNFFLLLFHYTIMPFTIIPRIDFILLNNF